MSEYNIFLASPKGELDSVTEAVEQTVIHKFQEAAPHAKVKVVRSKDEYERSFGKHGTWDDWTTYVATGVDYEYRTPIFNAVVSTTTEVGKATGDIISKALNNRRMVAAMRGDGLSRVTGVEVIDSDNWQSGWRLTLDT